MELRRQHWGTQTLEPNADVGVVVIMRGRAVLRQRPWESGAWPRTWESHSIDIVLRTDAGAALGVVNRRGVVKTRHIDTQELSLQNVIRNRELEVQRVAREENVADILAKKAKSEVLEKHMAELRMNQSDTARHG